MANLPLLTKFTDHLKQSLKHGFKLALELNHKEVTLLTLLYGLIIERGSVASELLKKENITKEELLILLSKIENTGIKGEAPSLSTNASKILERAAILALENSHHYIGTEHLLTALIESKDSLLIKIFDRHKNSKDNLQQELINVINSVNRFPEMLALNAGNINEPVSMNNPATKIKNKLKKNQALEFFTTDLTASPNIKKMDPVIGRDKEISRLIQILCRRQKNNPVLLGDPGVGKTAIVEGLAQKIANGDVPDDLLNKKVLQLDIGLLIAGTIYRGEFEGRLKQLLDEIKSDPNIIIFIDELHTIVGAGSSSGTLDAANILKPALARGEIRCIGATTFEEFKKSIESDPALERRFQSVVVNEPSLAEALQILKGLAGNYEKYHQIKISDEALTAAVTLADRYYPEKFFPDKAIDVLDEASSAKKLRGQKNTAVHELKNLERELNIIKENKQNAILDENFKIAAKIKKDEEILIDIINNLQTETTKTSRKKLETLTAADVALVVSQATGLPLTELLSEQQTTFKNLESELKNRIIGQDEVIHNLVETLKRSRLGLTNPNRPLASFLFIGSSGVGKTELAKTLADLYFPSHNQKDNFIRVDMSEFGEGFHSAKLVGAPAGYIGYKEGNQLADKIKHHPYSVVLFDEIDKAHPDVFNIFLQILDEGRLTDASGKKINFKNTIIIMTTNVGEDLFKPTNFGFNQSLTISTSDNQNFEATKKTVLEELKHRFKTEFLNRIDRNLVFNPLTLNNLVNIVELQINKLNENLKNKNIFLQASESAKQLIAQESAPLDQGARAIYKVIQTKIEEPLANIILDSNLKNDKQIIITIEKTGDEVKLKL